MNKRPGQVKVTTEVAFCSFCSRPRTLRREERQLGTLVRTIVTCETCHRTLSSTIGVASPEPATAEAVEVNTPALEVPAEPAKAPAPAKRAAPANRAPSAKATVPKAKAPATRRITKSK
jgi:hypothetical protein